MKLLNVRRTVIAGVGVAMVGGTMIAAVPASAAARGGRPLSADLTGAAEVPGPGDPDGFGRAEIRVNAARGEVCYEVAVKNITPSTEAWIHQAPAGAVGPEVVYFVQPGPEVVLSTGEVIGGTSSGCTYVDPARTRDIIRHPEEYYVNVKNAAFLAGAVRGQLGR